MEFLVRLLHLKTHFQKMIKDASNIFHSQAKLYARKMLDQTTNDKDL